MQVLNMLKEICLLVYPKEMPSSLRLANEDVTWVLSDYYKFNRSSTYLDYLYTNIELMFYLQWVCHDWSDEHCLKLLKNCYEALPDNGKVIVVECLVPVAPDSSLLTKQVVHLDCIMMAHTAGGRERTEEEFESLARRVGFKGFQVICNVYGNYIMEFYKMI